MANHLLDGALLLKVGEGFPCERAVDLETVDKGSDGDKAIRLHVLVKLVRGLLVEDDGVLGLVLDYLKLSAEIALHIVCETVPKGAKRAGITENEDDAQERLI